MIYIGKEEWEKEPIIRQYMAQHGLSHVVVISPKNIPLELDGGDNVEWSQTIMYVTFYRLLQEIDPNTLVVLSEPLRTQNRYDLTYNCIRNFLNQTGHVLVFQHQPQIDGRDDFMILFDFATKSRWKRNGYDINLILDNAQVDVAPRGFVFNEEKVPTSQATKAKYEKEKAKMFKGLGVKDPHTIPRNLYLIGGQDKLAYIKSQQGSLFGRGVSRNYVARNQRLNDALITTYSSAQADSRDVCLLELPHRFIDLLDFSRQIGTTAFDVLTADLPVDHWYYSRYIQWSERINETCSDLQQ